MNGPAIALGPQVSGGVKPGEVWTVDGHAYRVIRKTGPRTYEVFHIGKCEVKPAAPLWARMLRKLIFWKR
jgi:hypothetical protein